MSLKKVALSGVFWTGLEQFSVQGINFIVSVILARLLLPEEFGLIAMIGILLGVGHSLMSAGLGSSLIRTNDATQEDYSTVFFYNLIGSVVIYFIIYLIAPFIASFYNQNILTGIIRLYTITFIINAFGMVQYTRLTQQLDFKTQLKVSIPSVILSGLTGIIMAYFNYGVWSLVVMTIVGSLAGTIQIWYWAKWRPTWVFNIDKFKYHFNYGYKLTLSGLLNILFINIYVIIIGKFFAPAQVGYYNRADSLKQLPVSNIAGILDKVTFPLFAKIKDDNIRLKDVYKKIMQMVIFLVAPMLIFMAVLAEPLFRFLFTEKWLPAVPYFQILCFNGILYPIHAYNLNILKVKGRSDLFLKLEIVKKAITLVTVFIAFQFGIYGLLYGSVFLSIISFFINTYYTGKFLNYKSWEQIKDLLPTIFISMMAGAIVFLFDYFTKNHVSYDVLRLIFGSLIGSLTFFGFTYFLKFEGLKELVLIIKRQ